MFDQLKGLKDKVLGMVSRPTAKEEDMEEQPVMAAPRQEKISSGPVNYICEKCNYNFSRPPERKTPTICPYCGKPGGVSRSKSAQDIIDESMTSF